MSVLRDGDEAMHYSDNSHRWIAPPDIEQSLWEAGVRAHLSRHMTTMGGPVKQDRLWACRPARSTPAGVEPAAAPGGTVSRLPNLTEDPVSEPVIRLPGAA